MLGTESSVGFPVCGLLGSALRGRFWLRRGTVPLTQASPRQPSTRGGAVRPSERGGMGRAGPMAVTLTELRSTVRCRTSPLRQEDEPRAGLLASEVLPLQQEHRVGPTVGKYRLGCQSPSANSRTVSRVKPKRVDYRDRHVQVLT